MKKYPLSLSPDYCNDWTPADALREIIQNCLDSEAPFEYGYDGDTAKFTSKNTTLSSSTLLLGNTSKRGDSESVGGYGEGYKIALLVLCREGFKVVIENGNKTWLPMYEYNDLFESQALVIYEELTQSMNQDLTFIVEGIDEDTWEETKERCLYLQEDLGEVIETEDGTILKDIEGKLFVGGLYISDTALRYSYDFHPSKLKLNRDRRSVSGFELEWATSIMWAKANKADEVAEHVHNNIPDVQYFETHAYKSYDNKDAIFALYKEKYDGKVLADNYQEQTDFEERGIKNVIVLGNSQFTKIVRSHSDYEEPEPEEPEMSPVEMLEDLLLETNYLDLKENLEKVIDKFNDKGVSWDS